MGRPNEYQTIDAFTPSGSGARLPKPGQPPVHAPTYPEGRPYYTTRRQRVRITRALRRKRRSDPVATRGRS